MKKKNIFIGFNKDRERCLLYKLDSDSFIDLETKKTYKVDDLLETTILPYSRFFKLKGITSKNNIKRKYQEDAYQDIKIDDLFIGEVGKVTRTYDFKESSNRVNLEPYLKAMCLYCNAPLIYGDWYMPEYIDYKYSYEVIAKDVLLQRIDNKYDDPDYICLMSNSKIKHKGMLDLGDIVVGSIKPFKEVIEVEEELMPKNKVMELHMKDKTK